MAQPSAHASQQAASANRNEDCIRQHGTLLTDLHSNRRLPGNHVRIVIRMHKHPLIFFPPLHSASASGIVIVPFQNDRGSQRTHRVDLDRRRGPRHDDNRVQPQLGRSQRNTLRMVASRGGNHSVCALRLIKAGDLVVGPPQFEGKRALQVLALEPNVAVQTSRQLRGPLQRRALRHLVDTGLSNAL